MSLNVKGPVTSKKSDISCTCERKTEFNLPCGGVMTYDADRGVMVCEDCGNTKELL